MYDVMRYWETAPTDAAQSPVMRDYAQIWQAADKIVFSSTLEAATSARTRIEREFDPDAIRELKQREQRDISIGGPGLAVDAISAGLVDDYQLFLTPAIIGGGTRALPKGARLDLELQDERRFGNGVVYLRYRPRT
jgi:riboflavin biosynthesis pyrimidine reductase